MIFSLKVIRCDTCSKEQRIDETEANRARLSAVRSGWKSHTYNGLLLTNSRTVSRLWDLCPDCDYPDYDEVLKKVQEEDDTGIRGKARQFR